MAEFQQDPYEEIDDVLRTVCYVPRAAFKEDLLAQLRAAEATRRRARPLLGRMRTWIFSYPNGYHLREEKDETMNKSKLLTAFSVGILMLALAAFVGLVFVLPLVETPHEAGRPAAGDAASPVSGDDDDSSDDQAIFPPTLSEPVICTPITADNVGQLVELAYLDTHSTLGKLSFYPPFPALFVTGSTDGGRITLIYETNGFQELNRLSYATSLPFSQMGRRVSYGSSRKIYIYSPLHGPDQSEATQILRGHRGSVQDVALNAADTRLVSGSMDNTLRLWDVQAGEQLLLVEFETGVYSVAYSPDETLVAAGLSNGEIHLLDTASGDEISTLEGHTEMVEHLAFSPDGRWLASASRDTTVGLWDLQSLNRLFVLEGHTVEISGLAFSPDGSLLASSSKDGTLRLWDPATGEMVWLYGDETISATSRQWVVDLDFSPDGGLLAFLTGDGVGHVWGLPPDS